MCAGLPTRAVGSGQRFHSEGPLRHTRISSHVSNPSTTKAHLKKYVELSHHLVCVLAIGTMATIQVLTRARRHFGLDEEGP